MNIGSSKSNQLFAMKTDTLFTQKKLSKSFNLELSRNRDSQKKYVLFQAFVNTNIYKKKKYF